MPKSRKPKKRTAGGSKSRGPGRPPLGGTRINVRIDRKKLDAARRILGLPTATATIDAALDQITFADEVMTGMHRLAAAGGLIPEPDEE